MARYVIRRLLHAVVVLFGVSIIIFLLVRLFPGDPALAILGTDATPGELDRLRRLLGLDQPLPVQYAQFIGRLAHGDLGESIVQHRSVAALIGDRLPATLELTTAAILMAAVVGLATGVVSALRPYSLFDAIATLLALSGVAMPVFWLAMLGILVFSLQLGWLPSFGRGEGIVGGIQAWVRYGDPQDVVDALKHLVLPTFTLGAFSTALISRITRSSMLEVLGQDYVRTARAKGLSEQLVVWGHAVRNALLPVVTVIGLQIGALLGGAVIAETVFAWPGVGRLLIQSVGQRDYPVLQGIVLLLAVAVSLISLVVDLVYGVLNPRVRYE
jgi:peptide/nickel transport system permease protein